MSKARKWRKLTIGERAKMRLFLQDEIDGLESGKCMWGTTRVAPTTLRAALRELRERPRRKRHGLGRKALAAIRQYQRAHLAYQEESRINNVVCDDSPLACAMSRTLEDDVDRGKLRRRARDFSLETIGRRYLQSCLPVAEAHSAFSDREI